MRKHGDFAAVVAAWSVPALLWAVLAFVAEEPLRHGMTLMLLPVVLGSWIGGLAGGIGAVVVGTLAGLDLATPAAAFDASGSTPVDWAAIVTFSVVGVLFCATHEGMRRSQDRLVARAGAETTLMEDRNRLAQALDHDAARLAAIVRSSNDAIAATDTEGRFVSWNAAAERMFGYLAEEVIGRSPAGLIVPDDKMEEHLCITDQLLNGALLPSFDTVRTTKDGRRLNVSASPSPIKDSQGRFVGISALWRDITERKRTEQMLAESEAKYRFLADNVQDFIALFDADGTVLYDSPSVIRLMGEHYNPHRKVGESPGIVHPDDRAAMRQDFLKVVAEGRESLAQYRWLVPGFGVRWVEHRFTPIVGADGGTEHVLALSRDVTARRQAEEAQQVLVRELHHRTRNILAIVQSIARDTLRAAETPEAFAQRFDERLAALSRVQSLISRPGDEPITVGELLGQELEALGADAASDKVKLAGPEVTIPPNTVQMLGLAVHELATNARKHGVLAGERGRLSVTWRLEDWPSERRLVIEWMETDIVLDAEEVGAPGTGYGRMLIEQALPYTLSAQTRFEVSSGGLCCVMSLPLVAGKEVAL